MEKLSIAILAKNEANNLRQLLPTLSFASEVVIVDDQSTDDTAVIVKQHKAKLFSHPLNSDFAKQREIALSKAHNQWVLMLDADERLSPELKSWLETFRPEKNISGYSFRRFDWFYHQKIKYGEAGSTRVTRLVKKNTGQYIRPVHEVWQSPLPVKKTALAIKHYPHPSVKSFIEHVNFYSTINAEHWQKNSRPVSVGEIIFVPFLKFIYTYVVRLGFLDKVPGFIYSFMMSFHSFLSRAKLYLLKKND
jgi:glycosyltransferase involved in cell wall biosynthesis